MFREGCHRATRRLTTVVLHVLLVGCSSSPKYSPRDTADANDTGATLSAKSELERALLRRAATLQTGTRQAFGESTVVAEAPYAAASGRTCRTLHVERGRAASHRLACSEGATWFFVPDVFGSEADGVLEQR